jgi:hypothetical protein
MTALGPQFKKRRAKDSGREAQSKPKFGRRVGKSQTMKVSAGRLPKVAATHAGLHHNRAGGRARRAS